MPPKAIENYGGVNVAIPFVEIRVLIVRVWFMPSENHETLTVTCRKVLLYASALAEGTNGLTLIAPL